MTQKCILLILKKSFFFILRDIYIFDALCDLLSFVQFQKHGGKLLLVKIFESFLNALWIKQNILFLLAAQTWRVTYFNFWFS